jgi:hypothetical protein
MVAVGLVFLIACVNVANLLLAGGKTSSRPNISFRVGAPGSALRLCI